jgi:hypothetical protein
LALNAQARLQGLKLLGGIGIELIVILVAGVIAFHLAPTRRKYHHSQNSKKTEEAKAEACSDSTA